MYVAQDEPDVWYHLPPRMRQPVYSDLVESTAVVEESAEEVSLMTRTSRWPRLEKGRVHVDVGDGFEVVLVLGAVVGEGFADSLGRYLIPVGGQFVFATSGAVGTKIRRTASLRSAEVREELKAGASRREPRT